MYDRFKQWLQIHDRNYNSKQFDDDIQYRAVRYSRYQQRYKTYLGLNNFADDTIHLSFEIKDYENRICNR